MVHDIEVADFPLHFTSGLPFTIKSIRNFAFREALINLPPSSVVNSTFFSSKLPFEVGIL